MWCNVIFIIIVFIIAFVGFTGYTLAKDNNNSTLDQLSKSEYANKLEQLPQNPNTWEEPVSAMCYDTAAPPDRDQYICPVCGEMTLYSSFFDIGGTDLSKISYYRSLIKKIKKLDVKLDESELCEKCSPNIETRKLYLLIKPKNHKNLIPQRTSDITEEDINLLYEYSEGIKEHSTYYGKFPIINYKDRLEELLGATVKL
ncbi:MAG: hypothetical protein A2287_04450 [Candidatus Melainabacteria bacterium RIFOXYA12_FULL_32_12]|nr:MAG: hypothetical protein A2255_03785 [Candidatus Melainabacteria bacterium RIFOXYA2_FULL_32_9]OGI31724.1 MAG: hypothetical protein A2287_04450 [Candidatus Melainabacteria bacterium RIFOXYA12_FULL_32_12]